MPRVDKRGRKRLSTKPCYRTTVRRAERAVQGKPSKKKRADIVKWLNALRRKLKAREHGRTVWAIEAWTKNLADFDKVFAMQKAKARMRNLKLKDLEDVLKALKENGAVKGFTILPTAKAPTHQLYMPVVDSADINMPDLLAEGMSLCIVRSQSTATEKALAAQRGE